MSDFDKEAERERLREKYEAEEDDREATEKMSELLLQGATMTNKHCDACGSPIFRYDGQEFCPTCEEVVGEAADAQDQSDEADAQAPAANGESVQAAESAQATEAGAADADAEAASGPADPRRENAPSDERASPPAPAQADPPARQRTEQGPPTTPDPPTTAETGDRAAQGGDLSAARASLERTITRYAQLAEEATDVSRAREYLAASREAAETLSAVRDA